MNRNLGELSRDLTAAATRFTTRMLRPGQKDPDSSWQSAAWEFYSTTPEVRFAASWVRNAMSRARLIAARRDGEGNIEAAPPEHRAAELVAGIAGGPAGQSQLLGAFGPHLVVAGEGWIVVRPDPAYPEREDWQVLSVLEMRKQSNTLIAEIDGDEIPIPPASPDKKVAVTGPDAAPLAIRVWEPHPRRRLEADSPVRSALGLLHELQLLNSAVAAITRSRLTGRGVLLVPNGTKFVASGEPGQDEDDLIDVFLEVASTAYREPESAAATVPIVLEVPAETIPSIKRLTFESDFDKLAIDLREEAIRRFATGLEIPPEILLGTGDVNHWGQWGLQEEAIRFGIEPLLATVTDALTSQWLRPILEEEGHPDVGDWLVWYDTAPLRVRQNRAETALQAHDRGVISDAALRRETGFDESDAPTPDELADRRTRAGLGGDARLPVGESNNIPDTQPAG